MGHEWRNRATFVQARRPPAVQWTREQTIANFSERPPVPGELRRRG